MAATADIDDDQIRALRAEAGSAGDAAMVAICDRALEGDDEAIEACVEAINDAAAAAV